MVFKPFYDTECGYIKKTHFCLSIELIDYVVVVVKYNNPFRTKRLISKLIYASVKLSKIHLLFALLFYFFITSQFCQKDFYFDGYLHIPQS